MQTKLEAAKIVTKAGEYMLIADGNAPDILLKILEEDYVGTLFLPPVDRLVSKKRWIAFSGRIKGKIEIDVGAKNALLKNGKSLLAIGIVNCAGGFNKGDIIEVSCKNKVIAKGLSNYNSEEVCQIQGLNTTQIKKALGSKYYDTVVHRDNMVII
jgi:glutamate 5-kinase